MAILCTFENSDKYLFVKATGKGYTMAAVQDYVQAVITEIQNVKATRVLCVETELTHELTGVDTYALGKLVSHYAADIEKVAITVSTADKPVEDFYELVTNNRGLTLRVFTDTEQARNWIEE